jgi:murein DD-endopeptidase MepM/ murein hydrolase activator NlpD
MGRIDRVKRAWIVAFVVGAFVVGATACASAGRPSGVCIPGGEWSDGACEPFESPEHHLPFREGFEAEVTQGFHGFESHAPDQPYSIDFECEEGEPIVASASGVVWEVTEESDSGCKDRSCLPQENYVIIDHGDGTYSLYNHLLYKGALVEEGDQVCRGQVIGLCGNTGYSFAPHLHYSVRDAAERTIPFRFTELLDKGGPGVPAPSSTYTSKNARQETCDETEYSKLGEGAFVHKGVVLDEPLPLVTSVESAFVAKGRYFGDHTSISIHRKPETGGSWLAECFPLDDDGRFEVEIRWPKTRFPAGGYFLMITGSDADCKSPTWAWSYKIRVRDTL